MQNSCKMNDKLDIDKIFREKLEGFSEKPPEYIWENIQAGMAAKRRKKMMLWYGWSAVAAVLLFAFIAGWYFNVSPEQESGQIAQTEKKLTEETEIKIDEIQTETEKFVAEVTDKSDVVEENEVVVAKTAQTASLVKETEPANILQTDVTAQTVTDDDVVTPAAADTELIEPFEIAETTTAVKEEAETVSKEDEPEPAEEIYIWEQMIIDENARNGNIAAKTGKGWKVGVNVAPGYSSHSANYGNAYSGNMTSAVKSGNTSVGGGISIQYKTGKKVSVESGVYYAQNGQKTGSTPQMFGKQSDMLFAGVPEGEQYFNASVELAGNEMVMNSTAGIIEFDDMPRGVELAANLEKSGHYGNSFLSGGELSQVFDFVEVPVYLRYLLIESKLDIELLGGINAGIVVGNNVFVDNEYGNQHVGKTRDISSLNISGTVGIGFNYALGKNFSLAVEPRVNYYLNSINRNPEVDFRPYRVGVFTGLYYEF